MEKNIMKFIILVIVGGLLALGGSCKDPNTEKSACGDSAPGGKEACGKTGLNVRTRGMVDDHFFITIDPDLENGIITVAQDLGPHPAGSQVNVIAKPDNGYQFAHWGGDLHGGVNPAILTLNTNKTITAIFQQVHANALRPIARYDVVPHQRFSIGEIFNFGVVAFSKEGINRIEFTISGQGYSGRNPKVSTGMSYNPRTQVWEYWIPINAADFSSNGVFHVNAVVYGNDGGTHELGDLPLVVNATGALARPEAWVDGTAGNNLTAEVGNSTLPFATVGAAVEAIQSVNGGSSDGAVIYLFEGSYVLGDGTAVTSDEWFTLTRAAGAVKDNTILVDGGSVQATQLLKISGLTLESTGRHDFIFSGARNPDTLWIHNCRLNGAGQWVAGSNPVHRSDFTDYWTSSTITNADFGVYKGLLARGMTIENIGNDAFQNTQFVVNARVDGIDPGDTCWHADAYQTHTSGVAPPNNRIVYNLFCTNLHFQGLFQRVTSGQATNNAFVNVFMEMRPPGRQVSEGGHAILSSGAFYGHWDHLLVWHCSFPTAGFSIVEEGSGHGFTNSSFVGNIFWEFRDFETSFGTEPAYALPGNSDNNMFLYNHFMNAYGVTSSCTDGSGSPECPHWNAAVADSAAEDSFSTGNDVVDLSDPASGSFGYPLEAAVIIDRLPVVKVPVDINNYLRDAIPDIGAFER